MSSILPLSSSIPYRSHHQQQQQQQQQLASPFNSTLSTIVNGGYCNKRRKLVKLTLILIVFWLFNLFVFEVIIFRIFAPQFQNNNNNKLLKTLQHRQGTSSTDSSISGLNNTISLQHNILIIGDPQLTDAYSYKFMSKYPHTYLTRFIAFLSDLYMKKNFASIMLAAKRNKLSTTMTQPSIDAIVFMGDVFDGGRFLSDEEYQVSLNRFEHIFSVPKTFIPIVMHLAGNHDVNLGNPSGNENAAYFAKNLEHVIQRHERHFGKMNQVISLPVKGSSQKSFKLVSINSPFMQKLSPKWEIQWLIERPQYVKVLEHYRNETWDFIERELNTRHLQQTDKIILFSHIPLFRSNSNNKNPNASHCGKYSSTRSLRNKEQHKRIKQAYGIGYQNLIDYENTLKLFTTKQAPNIVKVFSGDDHSNCEHEHWEDFPTSIVENTVGTFSFMQGALYPSVGMLQTYSDGTVQFESIFLLPQWFIYIWYLFCAVCTILLCVLASIHDLYWFHLDGKKIRQDEKQFHVEFQGSKNNQHVEMMRRNSMNGCEKEEVIVSSATSAMLMNNNNNHSTNSVSYSTVHDTPSSVMRRNRPFIVSITSEQQDDLLESPTVLSYRQQQQQQQQRDQQQQQGWKRICGHILLSSMLSVSCIFLTSGIFVTIVSLAWFNVI